MRERRVMRLPTRGQPSLRQGITVTAGAALLVVSVVLIAYAEIRSATRVRQQQAAVQALHAELVETMLALQQEQLGVLARRVAADRQVDAASTDATVNLEAVLDTLREDRPVALVVTAASGDVLATSIDRSATTDVARWPGPETALAETRLATGPDGAPLLLLHAPIRRGDRVAGTVRIALPIVNVADEFFPGLAGLAFRPPGGDLVSLSGARPDIASVPVGAQTAGVSGESGQRFEAVLVPLGFGDGAPIGDLVFLREITDALLREELFARLTHVTVLVVILISLGLLTRALRLGFRPLGAVVHLLEAMSRGDTGLRFRRPEPSPARVSEPDGAETAVPEEFAPGEDRPRQEIGTLLRAVESFRASIDANNALIAVREQLDNARRIQQSLLPRRFDLHPGLDIFGRMRPALEVAGDFFDIFELDDARIAAVIADVSGKGLAPALFAAQASALLRAQCHQNPEPDDALRLANQALCERNPEDMFLTCILAVVTPRTGAVSFVNAGHCPPVIVRRDGTVAQVETDPEPILGIVPDFAWTRHRFVLNPGDRFLFYSDGFDEAQTQAGDALGTGRVIEMFSRACSEDAASSEGIARRLFDGIDEFAAGAPQADDITIIAIGARA